MYETVEETRVAGGQTAKVEETVLFAREVVGNAALTQPRINVSIVGLALATILLTRLFN